MSSSIALLLLFAVAIVVTARPGDSALFPAGEDGLDIALVSNGYHAGLAIPLPALASAAGGDRLTALIPLAVRFQHYDWIEIGWGDAEFYRSTPTALSMQWQLALKALAGQGNGSVLHVVGIEERPERQFGPADVIRIKVSRSGLSRLLARVERSIARGGDGQPEVLGLGLYGPSLFYRAAGDFNLFRVCNHWVADLLDAAGVPTTPFAAILPVGIVTDLKWRSAGALSQVR
ncbi:DUF2459 domain-containing protein [Microvirga flavescens]|uniref:DUF2459 domain-containing protein n=1 Tax=Microvirga flavescens TaxID=2249811 RepID=UPI00130067DC|nr:DUF2459 domain-containing protein [Microvirga flavescens]